MRLFSVIVIAAGLFLELLAGILLLTALEYSAWPALPLHLAAAILLTAGIYGLLPPDYREPQEGVWIFLLSVTLFLPVVGAVGLFSAVLAALYRPHKPASGEWERRRIPELPFRPVPVASDTVFLRAGLISAMLNVGDRAQRQEAVLGCRHLNRRQAVPILRAALTDPADEVRLLAYSMLSNKEKDLQEQIGRRLSEVNSAPGDDNLREELAELYWEYAYLDLARASLRIHVLEEALYHLDAALAISCDGARLLMRGRICSALGHYDEAEQAFDQAESTGMGVDKVAPHRAEFWFRYGDYDQVPRELRRLSQDARHNPVLSPVVAFWS